jgi:uncharacterized protein YecE (DUF72 family)
MYVPGSGKFKTAGLAEKLGCLLVQLPHSLPFDMGVAQNFFEEAVLDALRVRSEEAFKLT